MKTRGTILQAAATDEMRGRMQGVHTVVVVGGPRVADVLHGVFAPAAGAAAVTVGGGVLVVLATVALALAVAAFVAYRGAPRAGGA
jgi:hypothetical protein